MRRGRAKANLARAAQPIVREREISEEEFATSER